MKTNQKCVRISDRVLKYIESYRGDNFSDKLENLVLDMQERHEQMELDWQRLQAQINDKHVEMREVQERLRKLRVVYARAEPLVQAVLDLMPPA